MKLSKIEKSFRNKLNDRSIQPSEKTWSKLDELLTTAKKNKSNRQFNWLYIAATIIGITFIGIYMMIQNNNEIINEPMLVVEENKVSIDSTKTTNSLEKEIVINPIKSIKTVTKLTVVKHIEPQKNIISKKLIIENDKIIATVENTNLVDKAIPEKQTEYNNQISISAQELLAAVKNLEELKIQKTTIKIDASSLLSQVDNELEQTFKEKALQSINKNFNNLKTALASRNIDD